jgi:hypothetical protein
MKWKKSIIFLLAIIYTCKIIEIQARKRKKKPEAPIRNLVYSRPIQYQGRDLGNIELFDDEEPADTVDDFCEIHGLPHDVYHSILVDACKQPVVVCTRAEPAEFKAPIVFEGKKVGTVRIVEGEEPADIVFKFAKKYEQVTPHMERSILAHACKKMKCTREHALIYQKPVAYDGKNYPAVLLYNDGTEPTDEIYKYTHQHNLPRRLHRAITEDACKHEFVNCTRTVPITFQSNVQIRNFTHLDEETNGTKANEPTISNVPIKIFDYQEPIDVVNEFVVKHNLTESLRHTILVRACQKTHCTRLEPAKFIHSVQHPEKKENIYVGIMENDEPADVIYTWAKEHGLPKNMEKTVIDLACQRLNCSRQKALLYQREIKYDQRSRGSVLIYDDEEEPADVVHKFCKNQSLPRKLRDAVIKDACIHIGGNKCTRLEPVILRVNITDENGTTYGEELALKDGDEPADVVYHHTKDTNITHEIKHEFLMQNICTALPPGSCRRDRALLFSAPLAMDGKTYPKLEIYDMPDQEPSDVVWNYCVTHGVESIHRQLLARACQKMKCLRAEPVIKSLRVLDENKTDLGVLKVLQGEEPADAIFQFCKEKNATKKLRDNIIFQLCNQMSCTRGVPIIFRIPISHPQVGNLGMLTILEGTEPVDVIEEWSNKKFIPPAFRASIVSSICEKIGSDPYLKNCSRSYPLLLNQTLQLDGLVLPRLELFGNGEPADLIDQWAIDNDINKTIRDAVIYNICEIDKIRCSRRIPRVFSISISDISQDKMLIILEGEEAADAVLQYMRKAGAPLHRKRQIFDIACRQPRVSCTRSVGVYYRANIAGIDEEFVMWEDDLEPTDALYKFGKRNNLSWMARDRIFRSIVQETKSSRQEVMIASYEVNNESTRYCHRIPKKIPFRDYEVFVGSILATVMLAPIGAMRLALGYIPLNPFISSWYAFATIAFSVAVQDSLSKSLLTPFPGVEADTYFNQYHIATVEVREGQAPYDAVYEFGKSRTGAKFETLRTPKFDAIFKGLCEYGEIDCSRKYAREEMFEAEVTQHGIQRKLHYMKPENESACEDIEVDGVKGTTCMRDQADEFCQNLDPPPPKCTSQIIGLIQSHMPKYEKRRWNGRRLYRTLDSLMDAPNSTLFKRWHKLRRNYLKPCYPGPTPLGFSDFDNERLFTIDKAWNSFKDPDERAFYDQPCRIVFGCMCSKTKKSGDMIIETMQPE